jgi:hypothetical protein
MKSSEKCFLEIFNSINHIKKEIDYGESKLKSIISWSKSHNFDGIDYYLEGNIKIEDDIYLYYFLSNKRSYISLIKNEIEDINKLQYSLLLYIKDLFNTYSIDTFLNKLVNT